MSRKEKQTTRAVMPVTSARAQLYDLVENVLSGRSPRVELSHRDYDEHLLLIRRHEVDRLEEEVRILRSKVAPEPVPLLGIGRLVGDPIDVVERVRGRQDDLARRKRTSVFSVPA